MNKSESKYFNTAIRMDEAFIRLLEKREFEYITIKEVCEEAGVNRSTFYLHYENTKDLLLESISYMNEQFLSYFQPENTSIVNQIEKCPVKELILVTPQYLTPYLTYIKEHKRMFLTAMTKLSFMNYCEETYQKMLRHIFYPIMDRWDIPVSERSYVLSFYINGIIAIITQWLKNDCSDTIEQLTDIIVKYVIPESYKNMENQK